MAQNYVLLERIELNASAASVTFSNIPQSGYTDLKVVMSARNDGAQYYGEVYFNGNTTGYSRRLLYGDGSAAGSLSASNAFTLVTNPTTSYTANTFGNFELYIPNYTGSANKSFSIDAVIENNATTSYQTMYAGLWSNTAAITSITLDPDSTSNFVQYSTFSLYGLAAVGTTPVIAPKASGGNITTDGTYWYHTFLSSGTFTPATALTCDALVVAGGGGGASGGGGAGGLLNFTSQSFATTSYTVTVGAGGAGGTGANNGTVGVDSQIGALTLVKGGGYGGDLSQVGGNSGSGGGGGAAGSGTYAGGTQTSGQGNAGGSQAGQNGSPYPAGGGGGAGAAGGNASGSTSGSGGAGVNTYSSWASATSTGVSGYYAGGGGGANYITSGTQGSGGAGGGAAGGNGVTNNGIVNTGGGGGGRTDRAGGGSGGSGIVIIRYAMA